MYVVRVVQKFIYVGGGEGGEWGGWTPVVAPRAAVDEARGARKALPKMAGVQFFIEGLEPNSAWRAQCTCGSGTLSQTKIDVEKAWKRKKQRQQEMPK